MKNTDIYTMLGRLDEDVIEASLPPSMAAAVGLPPRRRHPLRAVGRFFETGWGVAAACAVVSAAVLFGVIMAGRLPSVPTPSTPAGSLPDNSITAPADTPAPALPDGAVVRDTAIHSLTLTDKTGAERALDVRFVGYVTPDGAVGFYMDLTDTERHVILSSVSLDGNVMVTMEAPTEFRIMQIGARRAGENGNAEVITQNQRYCIDTAGEEPALVADEQRAASDMKLPLSQTGWSKLQMRYTRLWRESPETAILINPFGFMSTETPFAEAKTLGELSDIMEAMTLEEFNTYHFSEVPADLDFAIWSVLD